MKNWKLKLISFLLAILIYMVVRTITVGATTLYTVQPEEYNYVFVGDSRTVGIMKDVDYDLNTAYICEVGKGYDWLKNTASNYISTYSGSNKVLVINLGVNDVGNVDKYIEYLNTNEMAWRNKGYKIYYVSVNPVDNNQNVSCDRIIDFNNRIKNGCVGYKYIDTYSYLMLTGFNTRDGLHYTSDTDIKIYNYIMGCISHDLLKERG